MPKKHGEPEPIPEGPEGKKVYRSQQLQKQAVKGTPRRNIVPGELRESLSIAEGCPPPDENNPIDYDLVEKLAAIACTMEEIGIILGVSEEVLRKYPAYRPYFYQAYDKGLARAKMSLRRAQYIKAVEEHNPALLIWLGKQLLGQREKYDIDATHGGSVEIQHALSGLTTEELRKLAGVEEYTELNTAPSLEGTLKGHGELSTVEALVIDASRRSAEGDS